MYAEWWPSVDPAKWKQFSLNSSLLHTSSSAQTLACYELILYFNIPYATMSHYQEHFGCTIPLSTEEKP